MIKRDVVNAKTPNELVDVAYVLLMGLRREQCFEKPLPVVDLANLSHFLEGGDALFHNWNFPWPVPYILNSDRCGRASVDETLVLLDGDERPTIVEYTPVFLDESSELRALLGFEMRNVEFLCQSRAVTNLRKNIIKERIVFVKGGGVELLAAENYAAVDIMKLDSYSVDSSGKPRSS